MDFEFEINSTIKNKCNICNMIIEFQNLHNNVNVQIGKMCMLKTNPKTLLMLKDCHVRKTLWPLSMTLYLGGGGSLLGTFKPHVSMVVVMNTSFMFATSLLDQVSFCKITFQPGFLISSKKNTYIA
jgi:hypothetical protein